MKIFFLILPSIFGFILALCGIVVNTDPIRFFALYTPFIIVCAVGFVISTK